MAHKNFLSSLTVVFQFQKERIKYPENLGDTLFYLLFKKIRCVSQKLQQKQYLTHYCFPVQITHPCYLSFTRQESTLKKLAVIHDQHMKQV